MVHQDYNIISRSMKKTFRKSKFLLIIILFIMLKKIFPSQEVIAYRQASFHEQQGSKL